MAEVFTDETLALFKEDMEDACWHRHLPKPMNWSCTDVSSASSFATVDSDEDYDGDNDGEGDSDSDSDTPPDDLTLAQKALWLDGRRQQRDIRGWKIDCAGQALDEYSNWKYRRSLEFKADVRRARIASYRLRSGEQLSPEERDHLIGVLESIVEKKYTEECFTMDRFYNRKDPRDYRMSPALQAYKTELWRTLQEEEEEEKRNDVDCMEEKMLKEGSETSWIIWALQCLEYSLAVVEKLISACQQHSQLWLGVLFWYAILFVLPRFF